MRDDPVPRNMYAAVCAANETWAQNYRSLLDDFRELLWGALSVNDKLKVRVDHAEFTGSMNDAQGFHELVNRLNCERFDELAAMPDPAEADESEF